MANNDSDPVVDFQIAHVELQSAKKKYETYKETLRKIPEDGVLLGEIINVKLSQSQSLLNLVDSLERMAKPMAFCCGGWVELEQNDTAARLLMHADKKNEFGWPITQLPVQELLEYCTPAPYGDLDKQETVYNPNVRLASECEASKFKFASKSDPNPKPGRKKKVEAPPQQVLLDYNLNFLPIIRRKVSSTLANEKDVSLQCYKMNVYSIGGFFSAHVDTPVDAARMIGTVVVCLPCPHTGGELIVKHKGVKEEFLFANLSADQGKIQWAAFFSDCVHEILPVKSGHRITVTYNIIRKKPSWSESWFGSCKNQSFFSGPEVAADQNATLDNIVSDVHKIGQKKNLEQLGIFLRHMYTMSALAEGNLKGLDQVLCDGLASRGLTCHRLTVLVHEKEEMPDEDGETYLDGRRKVFAFSREDMLYVNRQGPKPQHAGWKDVEFIKDWSKGKVLVDRKERKPRNCGNYTDPGEVDQLYFQSTVIIDIPERSGEQPPDDDGDDVVEEDDGDKEDDGEGPSGRKRARIIASCPLASKIQELFSNIEASVQ
ncbi:uncharacterized protein LOC119737665 isoform X1 [Patiria miniata]|uniref:Fe2OG dioxygenase domain-containing protein n=1 Tax=Patiria miniata TaxID=46514 RepID=A0A914AX33_PATMI|nr:uncharacterized protein LOC119737665 isoform X1 [Patiria miniata]XP_038068085.1 uncharacterized protein LOC119737665 isoform X1 [Patiria miniata]